MVSHCLHQSLPLPVTMASVSLYPAGPIRLSSEAPGTVLCWLLVPRFCVGTLWGYSCQSRLVQHSTAGTARSGLQSCVLPLDLERASGPGSSEGCQEQ